MTDLVWLQEWYRSHCDGCWEHTHGVHIETIDNPGWEVRIDLPQGGQMADTVLRSRERTTDCDWILCKVASGMFYGYGDPSKLLDILSVFRSFVIDSTSKIEGEGPKAG